MVFFAYWNWDEITAYWELSLGDLKKIVSKKFAEIYIEFEDFKRDAKKHIAGIASGIVTSFSGVGDALKSVFTLDYGGYKESISKFASGIKQTFKESLVLRSEQTSLVIKLKTRCSRDCMMHLLRKCLDSQPTMLRLSITSLETGARMQFQ